MRWCGTVRLWRPAGLRSGALQFSSQSQSSPESLLSEEHKQKTIENLKKQSSMSVRYVKGWMEWKLWNKLSNCLL